MNDYIYIPCDYESAKPANLKEENLTSYQEYTQTIAKNFAIEYAKDLNEQVDSAKGNGKLEGKTNKAKRNNIDTVVSSTENISGSGLHRVTIAPTIDKSGNVVMDEKTGLPKMTVYSFNKASKTPLESYVTSKWGQSHGFCINMNDYARHNLKEEYQKDSEKTPEDIYRYLAEHNQDNLNKSKITVAQIARNSSSNSM